MSHSNYLYALEDRPPLLNTLILGLQHAVLALVFMVYPLAVAQDLNLSSQMTLDFLTACVIASAASTALHFFRRPIGSCSLAVEIPTPIFLSTALLAGTMGGLPALSSVALISGVVEIGFARLLRHVRGLFPAEVCGVAVMLLGFSIIKPGMLASFGLSGSNTAVQSASLISALATLATMTLVSIYGSKKLKLIALASGLVVGLLSAAALGLLGAGDWDKISTAPIVAVPAVNLSLPHLDWSFVPLSIVMALVLSVDNIGMLVGIQRQQNLNWQKIDLTHASGGIQVSGIGDLVAGLFGGMPTGISSAHVGLAHATGAVSRIIALAAGGLILIAAFAPKILILISLMPRPVVGAVMVYTAIYMVVSGMTLILNRMLNERRVFVIGFALVLGLTSALLPGVYHGAPVLMRPILESPLAMGTLAAMLLTQLFRIGASVRSHHELQLSSTANESLQEFEVNRALRGALESIGAEVGAARAFLDRAIDVTSELLATLRASTSMDDVVLVATRVEDSRLEICLSYEGDPVPFTELDGADAESGSSSLAQVSPSAAHVDRIISSSNGRYQRIVLIYQA